MTPWFQYRDPLMGVLDYIADSEVRLHGYAHLLQVYLVCSKRNVPRAL